MKKATFLTVFLSLFFVTTALALDPGDTLWTRTYGGDQIDAGECVQQTSDGGYVIVGQSMSFGGGMQVYLVKTDASGDTIWTRTYGGSDYETGEWVEQTSDGGYIIVAETHSFGAGLADIYLLKTDSSGDTLWARTYGGTGSDTPETVQQISDGYIIVGTSNSYGGRNEAYLLKVDSLGDTLWTRTYGGPANDWGWSVQQTTDGGYIITGFYGVDEWPFNLYDLWLLKTDSSGDTVWTRTYGGDGSDYGISVQQTSDAGYIVAGFTYSFGAVFADVWLLKTDSSGDTLWTRVYKDNLDERAFSVEQTPDGGSVVAGICNYDPYGPSDTDIWLLKTDSSGDTLWTRVYGGDSLDIGRSIRRTSDGSYIIAGYTESFGAGNRDVYLLKVAGVEVQPEVSIEITPDDPPVTVPQGGSFGYTGTVTNNTEDPQTTDIWIMAVGPTEEAYGPFKEFQEVPLDPSQSRSRHLNQRVANVAPLGFYDYIAYCGDYPSTAIDSSFFEVEVIAGAPGGGEDIGWVLTGSFLEGDLADIPFEFALLSNYPNPFNASTVISYELPGVTHVKLEVYNLRGQKVATLVDAQQEAGYESVSWDASEVSSGLYFYKLTAGDFTEVKRMTLLR